MLRRTDLGIQRNSARAADSGFTLLELAVVMFVMGLIMMIALPYLGGLKSSQLRSEVRRLASRANYLCEEAGAQKVLIRLSFDLNNNRYFVTRLDPFAAKPVFTAERGLAGEIVTLPSGIRLRDVWVEGAGTMTRGVAVTQFYPGGYVDATVIHLIDSRGEVFTLGINPASGHVAISRGDVRTTAALGTTG
jgi:prepilin-type N-terminal cleavage/methylation domain-containing protein